MKNLKSHLEIIQFITGTDWTVFFLILLITLAAVLYGQHRKKKLYQASDEETNFLDLLLMGRRLTLPLFVATLVATWYGGIFGVTQIAFEKGVYNFLTQGVFWYVTYLIFAFFLVDKIRSFKAMTLPDLVGQMFGEKSRYVSAVFNFLNVVPVAYSISLGLLLQALFGGSLVFNMAIGTLFVLAYSLWGGFRAVVFSDFIQFFVMCSAVFFVVVFSVRSFGGYGYLKAHLPASHFSLLGGQSLLTTMVWGLIALSTLVDPNFYQRVFAARSSRSAKYGILISTFVWFCFDICTTLGGLYARAAIPHADSGTAYLTYAVQLLPNGMRGFVLAGIVATILSTLDSYVFTAGTTISYDLAPKKWKHKIWLNHLGVTFTGLLSIALAVGFHGNIRLVWKTLGSYSTSCLLFPILCGYVFPNKISDFQFIVASVLGMIAVSYWRLASHDSFWGMFDAIYIGVAATCFSLIAYHFIRKLKNSKASPFRE